jgi:hypothetical protein
MSFDYLQLPETLPFAVRTLYAFTFQETCRESSCHIRCIYYIPHRRNRNRSRSRWDLAHDYA